MSDPNPILDKFLRAVSHSSTAESASINVDDLNSVEPCLRLTESPAARLRDWALANGWTFHIAKPSGIIWLTRGAKG